MLKTVTGSTLSALKKNNRERSNYQDKKYLAKNIEGRKPKQ